MIIQATYKRTVNLQLSLEFFRQMSTSNSTGSPKWLVLGEGKGRGKANWEWMDVSNPQALMPQCRENLDDVSMVLKLWYGVCIDDSTTITVYRGTQPPAFNSIIVVVTPYCRSGYVQEETYLLPIQADLLPTVFATTSGCYIHSQLCGLQLTQPVPITKN